MTDKGIGSGDGLGAERGTAPRNEADRQDAEVLSLKRFDQVVGDVAPGPVWYTPTFGGTPPEAES